MTVKDLINAFIKSIVSNTEPIDISYSSSDAKNELLNRGINCFKELATHIEEKYSGKPISDLVQSDTKEIQGIIWLLSDLCNEAGLNAPYAENELLTEHDFQVWHAFCLRHALA